MQPSENRAASKNQSSISPDLTQPVLDSVLFPSDFSQGSQTAFYHALKAALIAKSRFTILHLSPDAAAAWTEFPGVRDTLERWNLLPPNSPRSAVPQLGIDVRKVVAREDRPVRAVIQDLKANPADLIVLATHAKGGKAGWHGSADNEPLARKVGQMTLYIPDGVPGFVSAQDGSISLTKILIPIAPKPDPQPAINAAARMAARLNLPQGTFTLLYIGEAAAMPAVQCPTVPGWEWKKVTRSGDVVTGIVEAAKQESADLLLMTTDGRNGFLDALRGSHSERILRSATCPLMTVPEGSLAEGALR